MKWTEEETAAVAAELGEVIELAMQLAATRCPAELATPGLLKAEAAMILRETLPAI